MDRMLAGVAEAVASRQGYSVACLLCKAAVASVHSLSHFIGAALAQLFQLSPPSNEATRSHQVSANHCKVRVVCLCVCAGDPHRCGGIA